ncbi:hypothetical protein [Cellulomonas sp.]|uniref:hypothetical protein n=1 Tax=Cellulomonas sp. TaxID=40001 RepID=UPI001B1C2A80|nr:hypothetical protein [Cellulomonas sp.]MBO9556541.1 hypothetical protein [Cellulomonas sp.]
MTVSKSGPWIAGAVILSLLLAVASWFFAISPVMASTGEANEQAQAQRDQNAMLRDKINKLKVQSGKLDELKAELAGLQRQVPPVDALADFQRQAATYAAQRSVTIVSVMVSPAAAVVPQVAAAPAETESAEPAAPTDGSAPVDTAPAPTATALDGFYELPISLEVIGTYANVLGFLSDMQSVNERLFLVSNLAGTGTQEAQAAGGRPATAVGDLDLVISGSAFVLTPTLAPEVAPVDPAAAPPALPVPPADKNPLVPLG